MLSTDRLMLEIKMLLNLKIITFRKERFVVAFIFHILVSTNDRLSSNFTEKLRDEECDTLVLTSSTATKMIAKDAANINHPFLDWEERPTLLSTVFWVWETVMSSNLRSESTISSNYIFFFLYSEGIPDDLN